MSLLRASINEIVSSVFYVHSSLILLQIAWGGVQQLWKNAGHVQVNSGVWSACRACGAVQAGVSQQVQPWEGTGRQKAAGEENSQVPEWCSKPTRTINQTYQNNLDFISVFKAASSFLMQLWWINEGRLIPALIWNNFHGYSSGTWPCTVFKSA